ncbi:aspartic peptidase domain-containing protein [Sparassis latifolia]
MSVLRSASKSRAWKGKERDTVLERSGANAGIVVPLQLLEDSMYQAVYTVPILVGHQQQNLSLQVDTGSSDLWIASSSCSTSACGQTGGNLYDPSSSKSSGAIFTISYAEGEVSGPVVWDTVKVGGYNISAQALAAATVVYNEPLESAFTGILGLALPENSKIAQLIPPLDTPNGAAFASNLFRMSNSPLGPSAPFISLALARPGSSKVPSVLGIGMHPDVLVSDPSKIIYAGLSSTDTTGPLFWKADVHAITVYVDGKAMPVTLGEPVNGGQYTTAVLDSGTPVILMMPDIASGVYGAIGISPASDGQYYVPCTTPLNMTITLDDRPEIPLHPLDLTYLVSDPSMCLGMIQNAALLGSSEVYVADVILGVPFLRNTYTVMAYETPDAHGTFPTNDTNAASSYQINPSLGLLGLTNPMIALAEFTQVRVDHQPLDGAPTANIGGSSKKLSVGVEVLIGLVCFAALCFILFGVRWLIMRRRWRGVPHRFEDGDRKDGGYTMPEIPYIAVQPTSAADLDTLTSSNTTLRSPSYNGSTRRKDVPSHYTDNIALAAAEDLSPNAEEFPFKYTNEYFPDTPEYQTLHSCGSLLLGGPPSPTPTLTSPPVTHSRLSSPSSHERTPSGEPSVAMPLLAHTRAYSHSRSSSHTRNDSYVQFARPHSVAVSPEWNSMAEFGAVDAPPSSFAGVGTAARGARIDAGRRRHSSSGSVGSVISIDRVGSVGSMRTTPRRTPSGPRGFARDGDRRTWMGPEPELPPGS